MEGQSSDKFGPLIFDDASTTENFEAVDLETKCLLCNDSFNLQICLDVFLKHLFEAHNLVIEDVQNIQKLSEYITYWREKFKTTPIDECLPSVTIDSSTNRNYFLLSTLLKEDKELRHKLKLDFTLKVQEFERSDHSYTRQCLFCRLIFEGSRPDFLNHLSLQHHLQLGNPQNLVFIEELIDKIDQKLQDLQCIYCEKTFPERAVLKEHMRKKLHKRINPKNTEYDRFYIVNYLEVGKTWQAIQKEDDRYALAVGTEQNSDEEYSDWNEKEDLIICLFCEQKFNNINTICLHLEADHDFDFVELTRQFDFYQKIKLINYFRRQIHQNRCVYCEKSFDSNERLQRHLFDEQHCKVPDVKVFDQPEFYFPTYENDAFLYLIDDVED